MSGIPANISNNGSGELPDRISSEIWGGLLNGFKWLSENVTPNNGTAESTSTPREESHTETTNFFNSTTSSLIKESVDWSSSHLTYEGISTNILTLELQATTNPIEITATPPLSMYPHKYPLFYDAEECHNLNYTSDPLYMCEKTGLVFGLGLFFVLVGTIAILGNCVLPIVVWRRRSMRTRQNYIKVSLAFNDMISGFLLLFSLPNMMWFRNHPEGQVIDEISAVNSPVAIVAGSCLLISLQGSLSHLMFLSADRFIAIKWPMWNRFRRKSTVVWTLVGIWVLTIAGSVVPALFPQYFSYMFNYLVFIYTIGYKPNNGSRIHGQLHFGLALFFPYVATILLTILTGAVACKELKRLNKSRNYSYYGGSRTRTGTNGQSNGSKSSMRRGSGRSENGQKPELAVVKTVLIMAGAFIVAWSIFFVVYFLSYDGHSNDKKVKKMVYMLSFYSGLSNSVANVIIYSVRDSRFRAAVAATFWPGRLMKQHQCSTDSKIMVRKTMSSLLD